MVSIGKVCFIGGGMMGTAMIRGLLENQLVDASSVVVVDPNQQRGEYLVATFNVGYTTAHLEAIQDADVLVLAVKPQYFDAVADVIQGKLFTDTLVISIMAGVTLARITERLDVKRVVRAMPNTPGAIGAGITAWMPTDAVDTENQEKTTAILGALGETLQVTKEDYLDMATAVSGSGPAYVFLFMEAMIDAAVHMGFSRADAEKLTLNTVKGAAQYALETGESPSTLRSQVTSPGGTTAEALYHMEKEGLRHAVGRGIWGAFQRSQALGSKPNRNPDESAG